MNQEDLELKITAMLLGELPEAEAQLLREIITRDPALTQLEARLKLAIGLLGETVKAEEAAAATPLRMSEAKREKLLAQFKTVRPREFEKKPKAGHPWLVAVAVLAAMLVLASLSVPNFTKARTTSAQNAIINNLRLIDSSKQQWALEQRAPATAVPSASDLQPYLGRGAAGELPGGVEGETYYIGAVGQLPVAKLDADKKDGKVFSLEDGLPNVDAINSKSSYSYSKSFLGKLNLVVQNPAPQNAPLATSMALNAPVLSTPIVVATPPAEEPPTSGPALANGQDQPDSNARANKLSGVKAAEFEVLGENARLNAAGEPRPARDAKRALADSRQNQGGAVYDAVNGATVTNALSLQAEQPAIAAKSPPTSIVLPAIGAASDSDRNPAPMLGGGAGGGGGGGRGGAIAPNGPVGTFNFGFGEGPAAEQKKSDELAAQNKPAASPTASPVLASPQVYTESGRVSDTANWATNTANHYYIPSAAPLPPAQLPIDRPGNGAIGDSRYYVDKDTGKVLAYGDIPSASTNTSVVGGLVLPNNNDGSLLGGDQNLSLPNADRYIGNANSQPVAGEKSKGEAGANSSEAALANLSHEPSAEVMKRLPEIQQSKNDTATRIENAKSLYEMGRYDEAQRILDAVKNEDASNHAAPYYLDLIKEARYQDQARHRESTVKSRIDNVEGNWTKANNRQSLLMPQPEVQTATSNFSTFSLNVSDASYKLADASLRNGALPDPGSIRSEEFVNAFDYRDPEPAPGAPIGFSWERAAYPFAYNRDLLRFSVKTAAQGRAPGRPLNIVLLLDKSGSMERADRVQSIHEALRVLASELQPQDTLSVIVFARTARLWVDGVPGDKAGEVADKLDSLTPEGGTNLEEAMRLAYATASRHYNAAGDNRVVLLTDGAANLGEVKPETLQQGAETARKQGISLDCFGVGWEDYNDTLLETLSRAGHGRYGFINTPEEASTTFAKQLAGALRVAAVDVKVQVEFNPKRVTAYRQIGFALHQLTKQQFRDNTVAAAQIGAAESGTALYTAEINPLGDGPICTVRVRFHAPGSAQVEERLWEVPYEGTPVALEKSSAAMKLAATASAFSEWLAASPFAVDVTPDRLLSTLNGVPEIYGADVRPKNLEWMIRQAKSITHQ